MNPRPWYTVSVAPMVDRTDRHLRFLLRLLAPRTLLYTEMHSTGAIIHGDRDRLLGHDPSEHPLALQIAGDDPEEVARAMELAAPYGFDEYDLNVGCPSDKVQEANYGACLMAKPALVADIVRSMKRTTDKPVTVKHRIGIDELNRYEDMKSFAETMVDAGVDRLIVHARIAILSGLSPKENREVPPLRYEDVYRLKREIPGIPMEINGGIKSLDAAREHLEIMDGVMLGRPAFEDTYLIATMDREFLGTPEPIPTPRQLLEAFAPYIDEWQDRGLAPHTLFRHLMGLLTGRQGARAMRRILSPPLPKVYRGSDLIGEVLDRVPAETLDALV